MTQQPNPEENKKEAAPETKQENDKALNHDIRKEEKNADEEWEEVKDKTSGVNKELEKKLEEGNVDPEDLDTQGG